MLECSDYGRADCDYPPTFRVRGTDEMCRGFRDSIRLTERQSNECLHFRGLEEKRSLRVRISLL